MLNDVTLQSLLLGDGDLLLDSHFRVRGTATCLQRMLGTNTEPWLHRQLLMPFGKLETAATNRFGKIFQRWTEDFSGTSLVDLMVEESLSALTQDVCPHFDPFYDWSIIPTSSYLCWEKKLYNGVECVSFREMKAHEIVVDFLEGARQLGSICSHAKDCKTRWWFQSFFIFTYLGKILLFWLIFFRWVEITNHKCYRSPGDCR